MTNDADITNMVNTANTKLGGVDILVSTVG